jgi:hypothetical protein
LLIDFLSFPYLQVNVMSPLMLAVKANHMHVAAALIEHGASIVVGKVSVHMSTFAWWFVCTMFA